MKHVPFDPEAPLVFDSRIEPWPERLAEDIVAFSIRIGLRNRSAIPAESPLILFPQLGLDIRTRPPMVLRQSVSGTRRVVSCTVNRALQIAPQASLEACRILFTCDRETGHISFTRHDGGRSGAGIGDFRIFCATGGANFPLRRVELAVPATRLRAALNSVFAAAAVAPQATAIGEAQGPPLALTA